MKSIAILILVFIFYGNFAMCDTPEQRARDRIANERFEEMLRGDERETQKAYDKIKREEGHQSSPSDGMSVSFAIFLILVMGAFFVAPFLKSDKKV